MLLTFSPDRQTDRQRGGERQPDRQTDTQSTVDNRSLAQHHTSRLYNIDHNASAN